jgi:hypothetical protein
VLQGDQEGELDALALLVPGLGGQLRIPGQAVIGAGILPRLFGQRRVSVGCRAKGHRQLPPEPVPGVIERSIGHDRIQPRSHRPATLESGQPSPGPQQPLLHRVVGVGQRPRHPVTVRPQLGPVSTRQLAERALITISGQADQPQLVRPPAPGGGHLARAGGCAR